MPYRKRKSFDDFLLAGAYIRLLKHLTTLATVHVGNNITRKYESSFDSISNKLSRLSSVLEDEKAAAYPAEWETCVFYGGMGLSRDNEINSAVIDKAKAIIENIFKEDN